jgi:hypothetical protein
MSCPSDDIHIKDTISEQKDWKTIYCETKEINDFAIVILNQTDCSALTGTGTGLLGEIPRVVVQKSALSKGPL